MQQKWLDCLGKKHPLDLQNKNWRRKQQSAHDRWQRSADPTFLLGCSCCSNIRGNRRRGEGALNRQALILPAYPCFVAFWAMGSVSLSIVP